MIEQRSLAALAVLLVAMTGCSVGDIRRDPPVRTAAPDPVAATPPAAPPTAAVDEVRDTRVAVGRRYDQPHVEFVDARQGYALFASCDGRPPGRDCPAQLYATVDGGRSWQARRHPRPVADNQQLYTAAGLLVLLAEPHGWYTSTDGGATFTGHRAGPSPAAWVAAQGRFQVNEGTGGIGEWDGRRLRPVATGFPLPGLNTVVESGDLVVAAGVADGAPYAVVSTDRGRTWRRTPLPAPSGEVGILRAVAAPDGELWLVGERPDRMGFPALWRFQGGGWAPVRAEGHPRQVTSVVPVGGGSVAVTAPAGAGNRGAGGAGLVRDGRYRDLSWPLSAEHHLTVLADGTLAARGPGDILLGTGRDADRSWARLTLRVA